MPDINGRKIINIFAYCSIVLCAIAVAIGKWAKMAIFTKIGLTIALIITAICAFGFAKSKRSPVFMIIFFLSVVLVALTYII